LISYNYILQPTEHLPMLQFFKNRLRNCLLYNPLTCIIMWQIAWEHCSLVVSEIYKMGQQNAIHHMQFITWMCMFSLEHTIPIPCTNSTSVCCSMSIWQKNTYRHVSIPIYIPSHGSHYKSLTANSNAPAEFHHHFHVP